MPTESKTPGIKWATVAFAISFVVAGYWLFATNSNVYANAFIGAISEIAWLPMMVLLFALPVFSFIQWVRNHFNFRSLWLYTAILSTITVIYTVTQ